MLAVRSAIGSMKLRCHRIATSAKTRFVEGWPETKENLITVLCTMAVLIVWFAATNLMQDETPTRREMALEACTPKSADDIVTTMVSNGQLTCRHHKATPEQIQFLSEMNINPIKEVK